MKSDFSVLAFALSGLRFVGRATVVMLVAAVPGLSAEALAQPSARQSALLGNNCLQCHAHPHTGAPLMGRTDDWQARVAQGEDVMLVNTVQGIGGMPPLGYCSACSEEDLRVLIRVMTGTIAETGEQQ